MAFKNYINNFFFLLDMTLKSIYSIIKIAILRILPKVLFSVNTQKACDIFILTTGPSLSLALEIYSDKLRIKNTFAVNDFCLHPYFEHIKPTYYFFADSAYIEEKNLSNRFITLQENIQSAFLKKVSWELTIFIPNKSQNKDKWNNLSQQNNYIHIKFINTNTIEGFSPLIHYLFRKNMGMPRVQNVLIGAIFISLNLGYKNIYLLGADHSLHEGLMVDENSNLCIQTKHFDKISNKQLYFKDFTETKIFKIHEFFLAWSRTFEGYHILKSYAVSLQSNIFNLTTNSYIDAFPKVNIENILKKENDETNFQNPL